MRLVCLLEPWFYVRRLGVDLGIKLFDLCLEPSGRLRSLQF